MTNQLWLFSRILSHVSSVRVTQMSKYSTNFISLEVFILRLKIESEIPARDYVFATWKKEGIEGSQGQST